MSRISNISFRLKRKWPDPEAFKPMQYNIHSPTWHVQDTEVISPQILRKDVVIMVQTESMELAENKNHKNSVESPEFKEDIYRPFYVQT